MQTDTNTGFISISKLLKFLLDKEFVSAEPAATTTKPVEPFVKKKGEERGRSL